MQTPRGKIYIYIYIIYKNKRKKIRVSRSFLVNNGELVKPGGERERESAW